eukprot:CAMPEP_0195083426 /NCGR_PEP_ID=MMETSP0448-20130528/24377_1 /TAXON_ID=66468 /ORGANISM="Heterocapsa triquestra, Strain CCMP 448" /LENGTH=99 /DNA_ID=CAMNT_0040116631 /DNA_START=109 /DNA_END=405 /DNA_ORIENTATION=+
MGQGTSSPREHRMQKEPSDASGTSSSQSVVDAMVEVGQAAGAKAMPISCRYTTTTTLEQEYSLESKILGTGMSGPVRLVTGRGDGQQKAVKSFRKTGLS